MFPPPLPNPPPRGGGEGAKRHGWRAEAYGGVWHAARGDEVAGFCAPPSRGGLGRGGGVIASAPPSP